VDHALNAFLAELYAAGQTYDNRQPDRFRRLRNLEPASAALLAFVVRLANARSIVEIGTSNGYSTIWLADAARDTGGHVVSVDIQDRPDAAANLERTGLASMVRLHRAEGGSYLAGLPDDYVDLLFLDAERTDYANWWPHPRRILRPGGVLAVDNVLSHPDEVRGFLDLVVRGGWFVGTTVPVGKGLFLAQRR
jgi:predicted O-methyltransferase YrrM